MEGEALRKHRALEFLLGPRNKVTRRGSEIEFGGFTYVVIFVQKTKDRVFYILKTKGDKSRNNNIKFEIFDQAPPK